MLFKEWIDQYNLKKQKIIIEHIHAISFEAFRELYPKISCDPIYAIDFDVVRYYWEMIIDASHVLTEKGHLLLATKGKTILIGQQFFDVTFKQELSNEIPPIVTTYPHRDDATPLHVGIHLDESRFFEVAFYLIPLLAGRGITQFAIDIKIKLGKQYHLEYVEKVARIFLKFQKKFYELQATVNGKEELSNKHYDLFFGNSSKFIDIPFIKEKFFPKMKDDGYLYIDYEQSLRSCPKTKQLTYQCV